LLLSDLVISFCTGSASARARPNARRNEYVSGADSPFHWFEAGQIADQQDPHFEVQILHFATDRPLNQ
jgi:hypothetical protein